MKNEYENDQLFLTACDLAGVEPSDCEYVGWNLQIGEAFEKRASAQELIAATK